MTDAANPEMPIPAEDWGREPEQGAVVAQAPVVYPEMPQNPHESPLSVNFTPDKPPMLTVRGRTPAELSALLQGVQESGLLGVIGEAWGAFKAQAAIGAGLGPSTVMQAPQAPAQGFQAATPPPFGPNVSVPQAAGFQGPPQGGFGAPQGGFGQQAGGFGGGGGGNGQGNRAQPKPRPAWPVVYKVSLNGGNRDAFKALREQNKDACKGKVAWAGGGDYWLHGDVAQGFAQFNPVPA